MDAVQARMRAAIELRELAIAMRRETLRRRHPDETDAEIESRLREWVLETGLTPGPAPDREPTE